MDSFLDFLGTIFNLLVTGAIVYALFSNKNKKRKMETNEEEDRAQKPSLGELIAEIKAVSESAKKGVSVQENIIATLQSGKVGQPILSAFVSRQNIKLDRRKKYLQIALNSTLNDARAVLSQLPTSDRLIIEAGTPLIKKYGLGAIRDIRIMPGGGSAYIVADTKTADLGEREVEEAARAGANAATCLGVAPIETIEAFVTACEKNKIDSMVDMMNVENSLLVLRQLRKLPQVVILHRGVDETENDKVKAIPYYQINQIKGAYNIMVAVAGGDSAKDVQSAVFNGADIVVLWKAFYKADGNIGKMANEFLQEVR